MFARYNAKPGSDEPVRKYIKGVMNMTVSFPGLGVGGLKISRAIFTIGGFSIYWYAVIITAGILSAVIYAMKYSKRHGLTEDNIYDAVLIGLPMAIVGARLYYVIFDLKSFSSFFDIINLRNGGLAIYGAVISTIFTALIIKKWRKIKVLDLLDIGAIGFLLGQCIGRWGNFMNGEVYGITTKLPWRMVIKEDINTALGVHPLFLYESIWNLIGFFLLHNYAKKKKNRFSGEIALLYVVWYGIGRGFLEGLRTSEYMLKLFGNVGVSQVLGFLSAAVAAVVLFVIKNRLAGKEQDIFSDDEPAAETADSILMQEDGEEVLAEEAEEPAQEQETEENTEDKEENE